MGCHFSSRLTATLNLCLIYFKITWALAILSKHSHKKFEINRTKIKGGCQSINVITHNSKNDFPLVRFYFHFTQEKLARPTSMNAKPHPANMVVNVWRSNHRRHHISLAIVLMDTQDKPVKPISMNARYEYCIFWKYCSQITPICWGAAVVYNW